MISPLREFERRFRPFSPDEAWLLFRLGAYGEAIGWTLLIAGILLKYSVFHGNDFPVLIAGRIHGTLFIIYMVASVLTYPSQNWSRWRVIVAVGASVPPYGSIAFERVVSLIMLQKEAVVLHNLTAYRLCIKV